MKSFKRKYTMSDSQLASFTSTFVNILTANLAELAEYGLTAPKIAAIEALGNQFEVFLPDSFYAAEVSLAVIDRNAKRAEIASSIQSIMVRIEEAIPDKLLRYKSYRASALNARSAEEFLNDARFFAIILASDLAALAGEGVTQAHIDALTAAADTLETRVNAVNLAVGERAMKAQERVELGNSVYDLVKKYAAYGKDRFADNPALFNQFVIYADDDAPQTPPDAPTVEVIGGEAEAIFEQEVTSMRMYRKFAAGDDYELLYEGVNQPVAVGEGYPEMYLQAQGRNAAGWGAMGTKVVYGLPPAPTGFAFNNDRLEWETDASIESVEIEASYDNGATYNQIAIVVGTNEYVWTPPSGLVFFRIRSKRGAQYSPWVVMSAVIP